MYPWISRTLDFWLQFCEKKCGLYMDVYGKLLFNFVKYQMQSSDFKVVTERLMKELKFNSKVHGFVTFHNNDCRLQ